jgi:hypothetical protein
MGLAGKLAPGDKFHMQGHGHVDRAEMMPSKDGERHSARLRLTHAGVEQNPQRMGDDRTEDKKQLRGEIDKAFDADKKKSSEEETEK